MLVLELPLSRQNSYIESINMRAYTSVLLASLAIALPASSATQKPKIGRAKLITKDVTDTLATIARKLKTGDNIHQNEVIANCDRQRSGTCSE